jgi:hypothetical protein
MPGPNSKVVETAIVEDKASGPRVTALALVVGLAGAGALKLLGASATQALVWLLLSMAAIVMLAFWLNGQRHSRDLLRANERPSPQVEQEIRAGRVVVTATVATEAEAEKVTRLMEAAGGQVVEGTFQGHPASHQAQPPEPNVGPHKALFEDHSATPQKTGMDKTKKPQTPQPETARQPRDPEGNMGATEPQPGLVEEKRHQDKLGSPVKEAASKP